jgi:hypothetical protein
MTRLLLVDPVESRLPLRAALARLCELTVLGLDRSGRLPGVRHVAVGDLRADTVVAAAAELAGLDGVVCWDQTATHAANLAAARLGLPLLWDDPDRDLRDKTVMHREWAATGVPCPRTLAVRPGDPLPAGPAVVKPAALQGGIGARLCPDATAAGEAVERLAEALDGRGPDAWIGAAARRSGGGTGILHQPVVRPDPGSDGAAAEYTAEVAVAGGRPQLVAVFAKAHVPPPYFAETSFSLPPSVPPPVPEPVLVAALERAVGALRLRNTVAHLEFCVSGGEVVCFELNPRLLGDPGPALLTEVLGLPVAALLIDLARGADRVALGRAAAARRTGRWGGFVDVRIDGAAGPGSYRGLDPGGERLAAAEVHPVLARGQAVRVSALRGPARVATVRVTAGDQDERDRLLRHWTRPERVRPLGPLPAAGPTGAAGAVRVAVHDVREVLAGRRRDLLAGWHALAAAGTYTCSPAWAEVSAALPGTQRARLVVAEDDLGPLAAVPCWTCRPAPSGYAPGTLLDAEPDAAGVLLVGSRAGYHSQLPMRPGLPPDRRQATVAAVVAAACEDAAADEVWVMYADDETATACVGTAPPLPLPADAVLDTSGLGHADWLALLPGDRRRKLQREVERWDRSGAHFDVVPLVEVADEAGPLLAAHNRRFGSTAADGAMCRYLMLHATAFGADAVAFTCRDAAGLLAFSFGVQWQDQLVMRAGGERDGADRRNELHFALAVHQPLRYAALAGHRRVHLGPTGDEAKLRRGAVPQPRWAVPLRSRLAAAAGGPG